MRSKNFDGANNRQAFKKTTVYYFNGDDVVSKTFPTKRDADEFLKKLPKKLTKGDFDGLAER